MRRPGSSCNIKLGAGTSAGSSRGHCPSSGASARLFDSAHKRTIVMDRRAFLKSGAAAVAAAGGLATPAISQRAAAVTLRFVPQAALANFDPIWGTQYVVRNASAMVWDTLYGVDENLQPRRQMVEAEEVSADGLTWTLRIRTGHKTNATRRVHSY